MRLLALVTATAFALLCVASRPAWAQATEPVPVDTPPTQTAPPVADPPVAQPPVAERPVAPSVVDLPAAGVAHPPEDELIDARMRRSWAEGDTRTFLSSQIDIGWVYLRPRLSAGYGKPFSAWFGVDANPIVSGDSVGGYAGLRLVLPHLNLRFGPRFAAAFNRNYLEPQGNYNRVDLDSTKGTPSRVFTLEAEIEASLPLGPGDFVALGSGSYVMNIPSGQLAFEESLRVIVAPPWVWRGRGGYLFRFGSQDQHNVGVVVDVLDVPKRDDSLTVRAGPVIRIVLSRRVEVRGSFVPTIISPDHIGLTGGDFTELGFRYRWATE